MKDSNFRFDVKKVDTIGDDAALFYSNVSVNTLKTLIPGGMIHPNTLYAIINEPYNRYVYEVKRHNFKEEENVN